MKRLDDEIAVKVRGLHKTYRIYNGHGRGWLASKFMPFASPDRFSVVNKAIRDVNLTVRRGTILGVLGDNGSGKSTLMRLIAGISNPTAGTVSINGRLRCLLGTGIGFNPLFTGRENILYGSMAIGIERQQAVQRMDSIIAFAELHDQIDQPTMYYSAGMRSRLAFAVAFQDTPDVLLLDEALAVGDTDFRDKCIRRISDVCASGKTVIIVTHALPMAQQLCTRAVLLDDGMVVADGNPRDVVAQYRTASATAQLTPVELVKAQLLGRDGRPRTNFDEGDRIALHVTLKTPRPIPAVRLSLLLRSAADGQVVSTAGATSDSAATRQAALGPQQLAGHQRLTFVWRCNPLPPGKYYWELTVSPWFVGSINGQGVTRYLTASDICAFESRTAGSSSRRAGLEVQAEPTMTLSPPRRPNRDAG